MVSGRWCLGALAGLVLSIASANAQAPNADDSLRAADVLPTELLEGPHHRVQDAVRSDGLVRTWVVESRYGRFEVRGVDVLRTRIEEIEALALLDAVAETEAFSVAEARAGARPFASGRGLGEGATVTGGGPLLLPGLPGSTQGGDFLKALAGFENRRREIAHALGVDPYAAIVPLREALDRHAWVVHAGDAPVPNREGSDAPGEDRVGSLLRDFDEEDLRRLNRIELAVMGVDTEQREGFLDHPAYGPGQETAIVDALVALEGAEGRDAFIEAALDARSSDEAHDFRRSAEIIRGYHLESGGLEAIVEVDGRIAARGADGTLVVPVRSDHATLNGRVESFAEAMAQAAGRDPEVVRAHILFEGTLSADARARLEALGLAVGENALGGGHAVPEP